MSESNTTVLLDPTGERSPATRERVARLDTLAGKTVGLLDISKQRGDLFLDTVEARLVTRLHELLQIPGSEFIRGAGGIAEGLPENLADATLPKFKPDGILVVHCGGGAGLFSTMIGGWVSGEIGSQPVLREIGT